MTLFLNFQLLINTMAARNGEKKSPTLTDAELKLMEIIWKKGQATVSDVVTVLKDRKKAARSSIPQ